MPKCNSALFIFRKSNFASNAFLQNLRLLKRTIVFLGVELPGLWQSSVSDASILIFKHLKISITLFSKCSSLTVAEIPCISMLLRRVYWSWLFYLFIFFILIFKLLYSSFNFNVFFFNPIQNGLLRGRSRIGGGLFCPPLPKICHTYPTMMKLGTVIPYQRKIKKM